MTEQPAISIREHAVEDYMLTTDDRDSTRSCKCYWCEYWYAIWGMSDD